MSVAVPSGSDDQVAAVLKQKERDLELAAKIGQSLLDQNRELQNKNEFLTEQFESSSETIIQLRHELQRRVELLRVYSHLDDEEGAGEGTADESVRRRLERLHRENTQLRQETSTLRALADGMAEKERESATELYRNLESANDKIHKLQREMAGKQEECHQQADAIQQLLKEIHGRSGRERQLNDENEQLGRQLDDALSTHELLTQEIMHLQESYADLKTMFEEAEEELRGYRRLPARCSSVDSLYDSLASELENSDSGIASSTPRLKADADTLRLELQRAGKEHTGELELPSAILARLAVEQRGVEPMAPPQTPLSDHSTPTKKAILMGTDVEEEEAPRPIASSTPKRDAACGGDSPIQRGEFLCFGDDAEISRSVESAAKQEKLEEEVRVEKPTRLAVQPTSTSRLEAIMKRLEHNAVAEAEASPLSRASSSDSLDNYVAPKMGEPGMPGTRDLAASIKRLSVKNKWASACGVVMRGVRSTDPSRTRPSLPSGTAPFQVEKDFARFRQRRGLKPAGFFSNKPSPRGDSGMSFFGLPDALVLGSEHSRALQPWRAVAAVGLGAVKPIQGRGVLNRTELPSPLSSPQRVAGLGGLLPSSFSPAPLDSLLSSTGGIVLRRGL